LSMRLHTYPRAYFAWPKICNLTNRCRGCDKLHRWARALWEQEPYKKPYYCIYKYIALCYLNRMTKRSDFEWDSSKDKLNKRNTESPFL
jgi:hypothetical protein